GVKIIGLETHYYFGKKDYYVVSHAEFRAFNGSDSPKQVWIKTCEFWENDSKSDLSSFFMYSGPEEIKNPLVLTSNSSSVLKITFPFQKVNPFTDTEYRVVVYFSCDGEESAASSDIICFLESL
ncbi:MAG TPA: hypothetical protein VD772_12665, partial [Anseongella sp.]|nr:hypothetical protein [Anseongella sp.]